MLIGSGLLIVTAVAVCFSSPWYVLINTVLGLLCVFTQAKGKIATQFIGTVYFCFYIFISFTQKLYGEAILYTTIMLPLYIYGIIHWLKHRAQGMEDVVEVKSNLSKKEWVISSIILAVVAVGVFFLLKALNTAELLTSTLSFVSMLPAVYLLVRRCKWNQVAFLINDFIVPILWLILIVNGELVLLPMCVYHVFQIIYDVYGLICWIKLEKQQKGENSSEKH